MMAWIKSIIYKAIYRFAVVFYIPLHNQFLIAKLRSRAKKGNKIKICFFAMNLAMWRYQSVYERFKNDERFDVYVVLSPSCLWDEVEQKRSVQELRDFFQSMGVSYIDWDDSRCNSVIDIREDIKPDIIFYPQQYKTVLVSSHCYRNFLNSLLCFCPYALSTTEASWYYDTEFQNIAWKLFYANDLDLKIARNEAYNKGRNVVVTGYPNMTEYLSPELKDVWKDKGHGVKRLIWAPHYSIFEEGDEVYMSNFLWMADLMVDIAKHNQGSLQIAFKPHPKLRTKLYQHPDWGKEKADEYYGLWAQMPNTQLETGSFIDLFKSSDAMVHDSSSFQIEYLYVNKPVMFVMQQKTENDATEISRRAIECHYIGQNVEDIKNFVAMVLKGEDTMREKREQFFQQYLLPENGPDVGLNMYNEIIKSLKL